MKHYDLCVVGGGFAGVTAALAAARRGVKTILVEKANCLGGAATNCLVLPFMPYWTQMPEGKKYLSCGIFREIRDTLEKESTMRLESFLEEDLKMILMEKLLAAGVELAFRSKLSSVSTEGETIRSLTFTTVSGTREITADRYIDATGDATLAYLAGCPTRLGREGDNLCQPMTLCFRLGNVDVETFYASRPELNAKWAEKLQTGKTLNPRENILVFRTPVPNVLHFNTTRVVKKNPVDPDDLTEAEILARRQVYEVYQFMKENAPGLENSFLMMTASEIGVRESRMVVGDYVLTETDCRNCTKFEDAVAACNYDIDIHNPEGSGTSHYYFPAGEYYTIPYRALLPRGANNLLVAGRCISSDHGAQASYRIMPVVACIGEAAGVAVACAMEEKTDLRSICVKNLQNKLLENGAFLGI